MLKDLWYHQRFRTTLFQIVLLGCLLGTVYQLFSNLQTNLQSRGVSSGFHFLDDPSGFGIIMSLIPYDYTSTYLDVFWVGLLNTLLVSSIGIVLATLLGFIVGVARLSNNWLVKTLAGIYVETLRNVPLLLQIFFWYFAVLRALPSPRDSLAIKTWFFLNNRGLYFPRIDMQSDYSWLLYGVAGCVFISLLLSVLKTQISIGRRGLTMMSSLLLSLGAVNLVAFIILSFKGLSLSIPILTGFNFGGGLVLIPEFVALLLALVLYTAAFIAEIVGLGIRSVNKGQTEAALALGLSKKQVLKLVVLPQALRVIIPPLTNQYLNLTKNSSLATAIAYPDLVSVFAGTVLNQTGQAVEVISMTMAVYLFVSLTIALSMNLYEKSKRWGRA